MKNMLVIEQDRTAHMAKGWGLSLALHGCLMLAVMTAMPKLTLTHEDQPFHWNVALVEAPEPASSAPASTPPPPERAASKAVQAKPQPPRPAERSPQVITRQVQRQDVPELIHREADPVQQEVRTAQRETQPVPRDIEPIQREVQAVQPESQPKIETVQPAQRVEPARDIVAMESAKADVQEIKEADTVLQTPVKTEAAREAAPAVEQQAIQAVPAPLERPQAAAAVVNPAAAELRPVPEVVARVPATEPPASMPITEKPAPVEHAEISAPAPPSPLSPTPAAQEAVEPPPVPPVATATNDKPAPAAQEQPPVVARSVTPSPARKADYGWLAESLHRKIVELRQYPSIARLNGWEGKVVLRVQIRQDGHLDSVSVVKSSGHETLDNAAMDAVKRACPLHMKHELSSPMVVVQVPINYSLNR